MTILALDIGRVRTGIAVSDPAERVASPLKVVLTSHLDNSSALATLHEDYGITKLLVGLPVSLDGNEHSQAAWVRQVAERLATKLNLPLIYQDERLSSVQAASALREMGYNAKTMRERIDMVAASIFLQSYLDGSLDDKGQ